MGEGGRNGRLHIVEAAKDQNGRCVEEFALDGNSSGLEPTSKAAAGGGAEILLI